MLRLIGSDFGFMLKRKSDIVQSVQQTMPGEFVDGESGNEASSIFYPLRFEVHCEPVAFDFFRAAHDLGHVLVGETHGQKAVLQAVIGEDISKRRCDYDAEPEIGERPHRMFARRPAAKVPAGDQD